MRRDSKTLTTLALVMLFVSFALAYAVPIGDIDLWWHLAAGKYMVGNGGFPDQDPFCYPYALYGITPGREVVVKGYWLSQVIFYSSFALAKNYGPLALRVTLLLSVLFAIYSAGRRMGAKGSSILLVLIPAGLVATSFTGERPQLFSFLLAPVVLYLLDDLRKACSEQSYRAHAKHFILLPAVMLVWANLHPGFIMGTALSALFALSEAVQSAFGKGMTKRPLFIMCAVIGVSIAFSCVSPNTYRSYLDVMHFEGSLLQQRTSEYLSPITLLLHRGQILFPYWLSLFFTLSVFAVSFRKADRTHLLVVVFLAILSLSAFRYIPFFVFITAPLTALYLSRLIEDRIRVRSVLHGIAVLLAGVVLVLTIRGLPHSLGRTLKHEIDQYRFPEEAASFLLRHSPSGNMFNHFSWGGYLIWRLYPHHTVFIDGRTLNLKVFSEYTHILWKESDAKHLFDHYGINIVIIPGLNPFTGELYELAHILQADLQWHLVFADGTAMVFVRGAGNQDIISRFSRPRTEVYTHVIRSAERMLASGMQTPHIWLALERAYREKGLLYEAMQAREKALGPRGKEFLQE